MAIEKIYFFGGKIILEKYCAQLICSDYRTVIKSKYRRHNRLDFKVVNYFKSYFQRTKKNINDFTFSYWKIKVF